MASFKGKVIAITGGASGIGQATAQLLATRGATVSIADVQQEALTTTADSIKKATPDAKVLTKIVDVTSSQQVDAWIQETVSQFGKIDGAANLAGITGKSANSTLVGDVEEDDFDKIIAVNVKGLFNCLKSQLNSMKEQGSGTIVNATSIAGLRGCPRSIGYCASKVRITPSHSSSTVIPCADIFPARRRRHDQDRRSRIQREQHSRQRHRSVSFSAHCGFPTRPVPSIFN